MTNTNGVIYSLAPERFGDCSAVSAVGTVVSCVVKASKGGIIRSATATIVCTG